jgi:hypothetical protein
MSLPTENEINEWTHISDNYPAHKLVYTFLKEDGPRAGEFYKVLRIWTIKDHKLYTIAYLSEPDKFSDRLPEVEKAIDSFRISPVIQKTSTGSFDSKNDNMNNGRDDNNNQKNWRDDPDCWYFGLYVCNGKGECDNDNFDCVSTCDDGTERTTGQCPGDDEKDCWDNGEWNGKCDNEDKGLQKYDECPAGSANPEEGCELEGYQCGRDGCGNYAHGICEDCGNDDDTEGNQDPELKKYDECPAGSANPEEGCELEGWQDGPEGYGNYVHGVCETCDDERPERTEEQKEAAEDQGIGCQPEDDYCDYDENCELTSIDCIDDVNEGDDGEDSNDEGSSDDETEGDQDQTAGDEDDEGNLFG